MSSSSSFVLDSFSYGKSLVRLLRVVRSEADPSYHDIIEYTVQTLLSGPALDTSYTEGDNSLVVATDSQKNTIHYFAKTLPGATVLCPEAYALHLGNHFLVTYPHITTCTVDVVAHKWSRIAVDGKPHPHSFQRDGEEKRTVFLHVAKPTPETPGTEAKIVQLVAGIKDLLVLKSSGSAFHTFLRDEYTTLKEVQDRVFSTSVTCRYSLGLEDQALSTILKSPLPNFETIAASVLAHTLKTFSTHSSASVQATLYLMCTNILSDAANGLVKDVEYELPNKHYVPINLDWAKLQNTTEETAEVFLPQADPSGLIKAKVKRA